jgi:signal transduction histidine kinase
VNTAERRRLSRELHDGLGGALTGIMLSVGAARAVGAGGAERLLATVERDLADAVTQLRHVIADLRPPALDELGLAEALRRHSERLARGGVPRITVLELSSVALDPEVELAAYRIASEALTNAVRHARATRCDVTIVRREEDLLVTVRDDGAGLAGGRPGGVGLETMRERAAELGGRCDLTAGAAGGTLVAFSLPIAA